MPSPGRVAREFAERGYVLDSEAAELLADAGDDAVARTLEHVPEDTLAVTAEAVRAALAGDSPAGPGADSPATGTDIPSTQTDVSPGTNTGEKSTTEEGGTGETGGVQEAGVGDTERVIEAGPGDSEAVTAADAGTPGGAVAAGGRSPVEPDVAGDVTGRSTGTGEYADFVALFRDRYERLSRQLRSRVNHRPTTALDSMPGGSDAATIGMVDDIRSTANGHWLVDLEDTNGTFPSLVVKDKELAGVVDELLLDEVIAVEGTIADDGGLLFADDIHFPDVPRTYTPSTADRHVQAVLVSDIHVGSQEFVADAWDAFTEWLHTEEAAPVEYLLIAGDMVEGVGVYPDQDEELDIVDIYEQYE
ncbi:MAG: DNA-directed DNA polymerase II small subunit, partial [Halobacteriaceae archaeon]